MLDKIFRKPTALNSEYFQSRFYRIFQDKLASEYMTNNSVESHFVGINCFKDTPRRPRKESVVSFLAGDFIHSL